MNPLQLLVRVLAGLSSRFRNVWYRSLGVRIQGYVWLRKVSIPRNWVDIHLESGVALDDGVVLLCSGPAKFRKLSIGQDTYVNRYTIFDAHEHLEVGARCMIGPHCFITDADHGTAGGCSVKSQPMSPQPVIIEDEVWIGAGVSILAGTRLGRGAVIGAGAVVTCDIPANAIAVGVPARVLKLRE